MEIKETKSKKFVKAPGYHHVFSKVDGHSMRWGDTLEEDPQMAPGPELLDIEIAVSIPEPDPEFYPGIRFGDNYTLKKGCDGIGCFYCYKGNKPGDWTLGMSLKGFKALMTKMPKTVCQIAFGITSIDGNPDLFPIMEYTRSLGIIPNITVNGIGITPDVAKRLKEVCGAVAVSCNEVNVGYAKTAVINLMQAGLRQVNIHYVLSETSAEISAQFLKYLMRDEERGSFLRVVNAVVLLSAKDKQKVGIRPCRMDQYKELIAIAQTNGVHLGFDSCGACMYERCIEGSPGYKKMMLYVEPCESMLFSAYINVHGEACVCSFAEGLEHSWDVRNCGSFMEIWYSPEAKIWREKLLANKRHCPLYQIGG